MVSTNKLVFVVSTSWVIRFTMSDCVKNRSKLALMAPVHNFNLYSKCTFTVSTFLMDPYLEPIWDDTDSLGGVYIKNNIKKVTCT